MQVEAVQWDKILPETKVVCEIGVIIMGLHFCIVALWHMTIIFFPISYAAVIQ